MGRDFFTSAEKSSDPLLGFIKFVLVHLLSVFNPHAGSYFFSSPLFFFVDKKVRRVSNGNEARVRTRTRTRTRLLWQNVYHIFFSLSGAVFFYIGASLVMYDHEHIWL